MLELEEKAYGPDGTDEEREAIRARVQQLGERILVLRELPIMTPYTVNLMMDRVLELASGWDRWGVLVDLSRAGRPDAATRAELRHRLKLVPRGTHAALFVKANVVLRAAAQFVFANLGHNLSVHGTEAEALEALRVALD